MKVLNKMNNDDKYFDTNSEYYIESEGDKEYTWLINNSYKYGFILRYPHESEYITGYVFEDWHFRYLGDNSIYHLQYLLLDLIDVLNNLLLQSMFQLL